MARSLPQRDELHARSMHASAERRRDVVQRQHRMSPMWLGQPIEQIDYPVFESADIEPKQHVQDERSRVDWLHGFNPRSACSMPGAMWRMNSSRATSSSPRPSSALANTMIHADVSSRFNKRSAARSSFARTSLVVMRVP